MTSPGKEPMTTGIDVEELERLHVAAKTDHPWEWDWDADKDGATNCGIHFKAAVGALYGACVALFRAPRFVSKVEWEKTATYVCALHNAFPSLIARMKAAEDLLREVHDAHGCQPGYVKELTLKRIDAHLAHPDQAGD